MVNKKTVWVITFNVKYNDGTEKSYIERITKSKAFARELMQSVYDDALHQRDGRFGTPSDPQWLDEEHTVLQCNSTIYCGYLRVKSVYTYHLYQEYADNIYSRKCYVID